MKYTVTKSLNGWKAKTSVLLGQAVPPDSINESEGQRQLSFVTSKGRNGITTTAHVAVIRPAHDGKGHIETYAMFTDFHKNVYTAPAGRVTQKSVEEAHKIALQQLEAVLQEAKDYYNNRKAVA